MRTLSVDYGQKRVGLAISDSGGSFASPLDVLENGPLLIEGLLAVIRREDVRRIVIGLPLNMDDTIGPSAKTCLQFARQLESACAIQPIFVDERLSSFEAEQQLIAQKKSGRKLTRQMKKERLDALAACLFLQAFLDGSLKPIDVKSL